jgi:3-hydroxybutyrate dehydrogenase
MVMNRFLKSGFIVFAGCLMKDKGGDGVRQLDAEGKATGRLITVQLNVTSDDEVAAAARAVKAKLPPNVKVSDEFSFFINL